jgi:hypothetical protein
MGEADVSQQLADDMLAIEPQRVRILTRAELKGYELARVDPAEQQRRAMPLTTKHRVRLGSRPPKLNAFPAVVSPDDVSFVRPKSEMQLVRWTCFSSIVRLLG